MPWQNIITPHTRQCLVHFLIDQSGDFAFPKALVRQLFDCQVSSAEVGLVGTVNVEFYAAKLDKGWVRPRDECTGGAELERAISHQSFLPLSFSVRTQLAYV